MVEMACNVEARSDQAIPRTPEVAADAIQREIDPLQRYFNSKVLRVSGFTRSRGYSGDVDIGIDVVP
jgi:hypothetical protein